MRLFRRPGRPAWTQNSGPCPSPAPRGRGPGGLPALSPALPPPAHPHQPCARVCPILPRPCSSPAPYLAVVLPWAALLLFCWRAMPPGSTPLGSGGSCGMSAGGFQRCGPVSTEGIQEALSSFVRCFVAYLDRRWRDAGCGELASHRVVVLGY